MVCFDHGVAQWPECLAVDSVEFRIGGAAPRSLHVMVAVGYEAPRYQGRVWLMRPFARKNQAAWEDFFDLLPGTPRRIVADMDGAIERAVAARFPRPGARAPRYQWSDLHVRRALENVLAPLHGQPPTHTVWQRLERALFSPFDWDNFVHAVEHEDRHGTPLPAALRWIATYGPRLRAQASNRPQRGPYSTGAVEAVNVKLATELIGERANRMGNRARAFKLLDLLTVGLNGRANERAFARPSASTSKATAAARSSSSARTTTSEATRRCSSERAGRYERCRARRRRSSNAEPNATSSSTLATTAAVGSPPPPPAELGAVVTTVEGESFAAGRRRTVTESHV